MKKLTKTATQMAQATLYATEYRRTNTNTDSYVTVANPVSKSGDTYTYVFHVDMNRNDPSCYARQQAEKAGAIQMAHEAGCTWVRFLSCQGFDVGAEYVPSYYSTNY